MGRTEVTLPPSDRRLKLLIMDGPQPPSPDSPQYDPRLRPTPDYGTLGPGSDIVPEGLSSSRPNAPKGRRTAPANTVLLIVAIMLGNFAFIYSMTLRKAQRSAAALPATQAPVRVDGMRPQKQAEALLERAVAHSDGAVEEISSHVDRWQGHLQWDSQMATLTTAALNSSDMRVRQSGVEVELAAYGLPKNSSTFESLAQTANSSNQQRKVWSLWSLGLLGNRGVETDRVIDVLKMHLKDPDEESRRWAVDGLALVGTSSVIAPLLETMHDDPSPSVRERAACSIAESGMFTQEERLTAVPPLLKFTDDPSLDAPTHAWAFHALSDITHQHLPSDSKAWRDWYNSTQSN